MEKRNNGLVLGLDIGVTSVGYGIVNRETGEAVDFGVRLFSEWDPANNQSRREKRSGRRLRSRRKNRLQDMKKISCGSRYDSCRLCFSSKSICIKS